MTNATSASNTTAKDPICGMSVNEATALHVERDGKTAYFCGDKCKQEYLAAPNGAKPAEKSNSCCS